MYAQIRISIEGMNEEQAFAWAEKFYAQLRAEYDSDELSWSVLSQEKEAEDGQNSDS